MNTLQIKGNWNIIKGKLKQKWSRLTDDDLQYVEGQEDELIGRIQKRTGEAREEVEKIVNETCSVCSRDLAQRRSALIRGPLVRLGPAFESRCARGCVEPQLQ
jgi:uncharacterized protein YjbJ (UPF0337 family)